MGKTSFGGPVYGAKGLLWHKYLEVGIVSTALQTLGVIVVPAYEELFVTELHVHRQSTGSTSLIVALADDSTRTTGSTRTLAASSITSSLANAVGSTTLAADGGEYEGVRVAANSTILFRLTGPLSSAAALASSGVDAWVYGFTRFVSSTRAE